MPSFSQMWRTLLTFILILAALTACGRSHTPVRHPEPAALADESPDGKVLLLDDNGAEAGEAPVLHELAAPDTAPAKAYRFNLDGAIQQALMHNLSLMTAADSVRRSHFSVISAESEFEVKVVPRAGTTLSGSGGSSESSTNFGLELSKKLPFGTTVGTFGDMYKNDDVDSSRVGLELNQPLLRGLGTEVTQHGLLQARFAMLSSERSFIQFQETLIVSVVRAFYDIIRYREFVELNEKSAERTRRYVEAARAREKVGLASRIDVLRGEIQLSQAEDSLLSAHEAYESAVDNFRVLLGFDPQEDVEIVSDLSYNEFSVDVQEAINLAIRNRLDLAITRDEIRESERSLRVAKNQTLPQLDLVFGYQWTGTGDSFRDSGPDEGRWMLGLVTSTDVRRTAEHARYEQSKLDLDARKRNYRFTQDTIVREVKDAVRQLEKNRERMGIQQAEIKLAGQKLRLAEIKFDRGLADNFDLIDAEEQMTRAETAYISAVTDYIVAQVQLKKTIGTLIECPDGVR